MSKLLQCKKYGQNKCNLKILGFCQATLYLAELFRQATFYLVELFQHAMFYLAELFLQITSPFIIRHLIMLTWAHLITMLGSIKRLGQVARAIGAAGSTQKCVRHEVRLPALLYQVACFTNLGCVLYYIRLRVPHKCMRQYIVTSLKRLGQVAGARRECVRIHSDRKWK